MLGLKGRKKKGASLKGCQIIGYSGKMQIWVCEAEDETGAVDSCVIVTGSGEPMVKNSPVCQKVLNSIMLSQLPQVQLPPPQPEKGGGEEKGSLLLFSPRLPR